MVDYKDTTLLRDIISDRGKIMDFHRDRRTRLPRPDSRGRPDHGVQGS
jgi:hypothetical protein